MAEGVELDAFFRLIDEHVLHTGMRAEEFERAAEEFNRLAVLGNHHMNLQAIKVPLLAGGVAPIIFTLIDFA